MRTARALAGAVALAAGLVAVAALFVPAPFRAAATMMVERTGLPAVLREVDARIRAVEELPARIWERLRAPFSAGDEPGEEADPPESPLAGIPPPAVPEPPAPDRLESAVAGGLVRMVELGLRALTLVIALSVAVLSLALWALAAVAVRLGEARSRARALEERVAALEAAGPGPATAG